MSQEGPFRSPGNFFSSLISEITSSSSTSTSINEHPMTSAMPSTTPMDIEQKISITLQHGNHRELIVIERSEQPHVFYGLLEKARQLAAKGNSQGNGSVVEVIVVDRNEKPTVPHVVEVNTYLTPTFCDYCGEILMGLVKQGLQCQRCRCNFHKKCAFASRNNCAKNTPFCPPTLAHQMTSFSPSIPQMSAPYHEEIPSPSQQHHPSSPYALPHTFAVHNYKTLTVCKVCDKMLFGIMKQGMRCRDCKVNVHKKCAGLLPPNCHIAEGSITAFEQLSVSEMPSLPPEEGPSESGSIDSDLIPLSRIPGQAAARAAAKQTHEGWMIHFLLNDPQRRLRNYWILSNNVLSMYNEYSEGVGVNTSRCYKQIPLSEILAITPYNGDPIDSRFPPHVFEMRTTTNQVYCAVGRLDERVTRFLSLQILSALRYLHAKGIAHCDLKPENVLLSELSSNFPQTKLCDFGYARFIGESQFRKTIVGTPAYLPPEVLQKRGYNKSLDMWSVGVIIYVTLSGTFPFNDGEEISEQIQNAAFMFPSDPWSSVSKQAVDLIQRLLRVNIEERLNIEECLAHEWLQSATLFNDLRALEMRLGGERYLTNGQDDAHYARLLQQQQADPTLAQQRFAIAQQQSLLDL
ncbi:unnamed protein product, partial [Mesorhabditis belari]|uniref:Protein kinase C n=1 Tax=Mesorhabditis belari TaxID=2138241 RepID=A0AAF3EV78_9BILA